MTTRAFVFVALLWVAPASVRAQGVANANDFECSLRDSVGDASVGSNYGIDASWRDIVLAGIKRHGSVELFSMDMAGSIPDFGDPQNRQSVAMWAWGISSGPVEPKAVFTPPYSPGGMDCFVVLKWELTRYRAYFVDQRLPSLGGFPPAWEVSCKVRDKHVVVAVPVTVLGDFPRFFYWAPSLWGAADASRSDAHPADSIRAAASCP